MINESYPMRSWLCLLLLPLAACGGGQTGRLDHPLGRQLTQQVAQSCAQELAYHKTVIDRRADSLPQEDTTFAPVPKVPFGEAADGSDSLNYLLLRDLAYVGETYYDDPYLIDNLDVQRRQDTLIARVQPDKAQEVELQTQKILYQRDSLLRFVESELRKESWLYAMHIDIQVQFDSAGRYQQHHLDVTTEVPLLGRTFRAEVQGQGRY